MPKRVRAIIGGVDTHTATHHAALIDRNGRLLADAQFPATPAGYTAMLRWMQQHGRIDKVGIEGTGAYGAGLARYLHEKGVAVREVPRPDRRLRRQRGKSDPIDAEAAARTVLAGKDSGPPKLATGPIEAIRMIRVARAGAMKARTAAINTLKAMVVTAPEPLRTKLRDLSRWKLITECRQLEPDSDDLTDPVNAAELALHSIATRAHALGQEARALHKRLQALTNTVAPATSALFALGPETVSALLVAVGDNPDRLRSEAAFARLCAAAPIPASSGKTDRHRLHRGGDRSANKALHTAVVVRLRYHQGARAYAVRRKAQGLSMPEIIRCQKRYLAREVFGALRTDYTRLTT